MAEKRGRPHDRPYDTFGSGRQYAKRQKPNDSWKGKGPRNDNIPSSPHLAQQPQNHRNDKTNPVLREIARLPVDPKNCAPCKVVAAEMQTGMIALLDQLIQQEDGSPDDNTILYHARALHDRLLSRASKALPSKSKRLLDDKRPEREVIIEIPPYLEKRIAQSKDLPPPPPITEPYLQEAVFTHSSANDARVLNTKGYRADAVNYERLEFLGDAYIEVIASRLIYSRFPDLEPSQQSHFRELLVKNETLGQFSNAYGFGDRLKHGAHTSQSKNWTKVLADVFEAYVAAIVLSDPDTGYTTAENWLTELWTPKLLEFKIRPIENQRAREEINKLLMAKDIKLDYREERDMVLNEGKQQFFIGLYLTGWGFHDEWLGSGEGQNKSQACVFAAMDALKNRKDIIGRANKRKLEKYPPAFKENADRSGYARSDSSEK